MKMNINLLVILFISIFYISSCKQTEQPPAENLAKSYDLGYQHGQFTEDDRSSRIKSIGEDFDRLIKEYSNTKKIPGIAYGIVVDDQLVHSGATGFINIDKKIEATPTSVFRIASMTKSFTSMAILMLRDEGRLSLSEPAEKYIPEMKGIVYPTLDAPLITIENLLTMTAGFPEDNPWGDRQLDETEEMLLGLINNGVSFSNSPSYAFEYSNTGYALLGQIIKNVSGKPYQDYIDEKIFQPLGMNNTYWEYENIPEEVFALGYRWEEEEWKLEPILHDGSYGAMGGLITTIEDFSKYVSLHLSAWPPRNDVENDGIKRSSLREMHTPQFPRLNAKATDYADNPCATMAGYGYGLGITTDCNGIVRVAHGGALPGYGSNYQFFPEYGIGIMAFGNLTYTTPWPLKEVLALIFDKAKMEPRKLPVSDILAKRKDQIVQLVQTWDEALEKEIVAENFYPDFSKERRMKEISAIMEKAGKIISISELNPQNQLRGTFIMEGEKEKVELFFTLTPEKDPKLQQLDVAIKEN